MVYLVLMLGIGVAPIGARLNLFDYILGGRSIGPTTAALSAGASDMSGWLLLGLPGQAMRWWPVSRPVGLPSVC